MKRLYTFIFSMLVIASPFADAEDTDKHTAVLNQQWLKALVSIEVLNDKGGGTPIGTGFLVGSPGKHVVLITARHVVFEQDGNGSLIQNLGYRINNKNGDSLLVPDAYATGVIKSTWIKAPSDDVACRLIVWGDEADFLSIPLSSFLPYNQIEAGAPLFIMGFPLGLRSEKYASPIVRRGTVGRKDDSNVIVDGFVFPGNSGGPVIYEPTLQVGAGLSTQILQGSWLLGMVVSEISYIEPAISIQTKRPRITFEENAGLCNVVPADVILKLLKNPEFKKNDQQK